MPMPRRIATVVRFCAFCGEEFSQEIRPSQPGRITCKPECARSYHSHRMKQRYADRKCALVLLAASKVVHHGGIVYHSEIAEELGWTRERVRHYVRELESRGKWRYKVTGTKPKRHNLVTCDHCEKDFIDRYPWKVRDLHFCSSECQRKGASAFLSVRHQRKRIAAVQRNHDSPSPAHQH
jgi:hypothetical protein